MCRKELQKPFTLTENESRFFVLFFLPLAVINGYGCDSDKEPHKQNECLIAKYFKQMIDKALTLTEAYNAPSLSRCARSTKQMFAS